MKNYYEHQDRAIENISGPFYTVSVGCDCGCGLPESSAPELLRMTDDRSNQSYFYKQPETNLEIASAINAVNVCPIHDVRYGGQDPEIIKRIDPTQTDYNISKNGSVVLNEINT